jgi:hypothetical protein
VSGSLLGSNQWFVVEGAGKGGHSKRRNPLGEVVVWYVSLRGNIEIRCFVPADAA